MCRHFEILSVEKQIICKAYKCTWTVTVSSDSLSVYFINFFSYDDSRNAEEDLSDP